MQNSFEMTYLEKSLFRDIMNLGKKRNEKINGDFKFIYNTNLI